MTNVNRFHCTICHDPDGYIAEGGVLPYCQRHHDLRKAKREREYLESVVAHPVARTKEEIKAAFVQHRREQLEAEETDLIRQVDDDEAMA